MTYEFLLFSDYFNSQRTEKTLKREIETLVKRNSDYQESLNICKEDVRHINNAQQSKAQNVKQVAYKQVKQKQHCDLIFFMNVVKNDRLFSLQMNKKHRSNTL